VLYLGSDFPLLEKCFYNGNAENYYPDLPPLVTMYPVLIFLHSIIRWLVLITLLIAIYRGFGGWRKNLSFTETDNSTRHVAATFSHVQLMIGYVLYFNSPFIAYFRSNFSDAVKQFDLMFFGIIHITLMTISIILITIGSSLAKRQETDLAKFRTMTIFYVIALILILVAIPWPFSPLSARPYLRAF
jgi:uncharacterized Tic20 family protein